MLFNAHDAEQLRQNSANLISGRSVKDNLFKQMYAMSADKHEYDLSTELEYPWRQAISAVPTLQTFLARGVTQCTAKFFVDEADANYGGRPRLDIVIYFADGTWVRWHPKASPITSADPTTAAVTKRRNPTSKMERDHSFFC
jgi:hypothetical protein